MRLSFSRLLRFGRDTDPYSPQARQGRTLNLMLIGVALTCVVMLICLLVLDLFHFSYTGREYLYLGSLLALAAMVIIALVERYVSVPTASLIFTIAISGIILLSDSPRAFIEGQSIFFLVFPMVVAGLLLRPWAGYLVAAVIFVGEIGGYFYYRSGFPNVGAIILFFIIAWIIQQTTSQLERAMRQVKKESLELTQSEARYRSLIDLLPVGVIVNQEGRIVMVNPAGVRLAGASSEAELIGKSILDHVHPKIRDQVLQRMQAALSQGMQSDIVEEELLRQDGSSFYAETTGLPFIYKDKPAILVVIIDVTEKRRTHEAITAQNRRIQEISRKLLDVQEQEKHLLAAELHDDLGQSLTSLKLMLELSSRTGPQAGRQEKLTEARSVVSELMSKVRNLSLDLRPAMLDDFGLFAALRWWFDRFCSQTGISVQCNFDLDCAQRFEPPLETAAFRIIQEALTNVARHASVQEAQVSLSTESGLSIEVTDQGKGFDVSQVTGSSTGSTGISGMQERARLLGGSVEITSSPGSGTRVLARLPLAGSAQ